MLVARIADQNIMGESPRKVRQGITEGATLELGHKHQERKQQALGNSLAVQWLGLYAFSARGACSIPGQGTKMPQEKGKKKEKKIAWTLSVQMTVVNNLQTTECKQMSCVSWGHVKKSQGFRLQVYSTLNSKLKTEKDFPHSSVGKESTCNAGDLGLIPGSEDPLKKGMATHSSILAWRSHGQRSLVSYSSGGCRVRHD